MQQDKNIQQKKQHLSEIEKIKQSQNNPTIGLYSQIKFNEGQNINNTNQLNLSNNSNNMIKIEYDIKQQINQNKSLSQPSYHSSQQEQSLSPYPGASSQHNQDQNQKKLQENKKQNIIQEQNKQQNQQPQQQQQQQPQQAQKKRYKYCCKTCKHTDKNKKACVCVVPLTQRRTIIGDIGCQTCSCKGCSKQDYISRGQDPQYKPGDSVDNDKRRDRKNDSQFEARNGCCKRCMKAFSKNNKACLCQVPQQVRKGKIPQSGCKTCGCFGCNPQDKKQKQKQLQRQKDKQKRSRYSRSRSRQKKHRRHKSKSKKRRSQSQESHQQIIDPIAMNFYNIDRSVIGSMILNDYQLSPLIFGFGVPQRSQSYIIGRPK